MKNLLLASTALVLSAGVAAAEVAVSGDARMGVASAYDAVTDNTELNFSSRARVKFTLSGETDGGLGFGASFRADQAGTAKNGTEGSVYVSGAFGKVEMGDTVSAPEALFGDLPEIGFTDLEMNVNNAVISSVMPTIGNDVPYITGDNAGGLTNATGPAMLYTYTTGAISVAASMSDGKAGGVDSAQEYALAGSYNFGSYAVGIGYEVLDLDGAGKAKQLGIAGTANFGDTAVKGYYAQGDDLLDGVDTYGLGVESVFGATTVKGYYQVIDASDIVGGEKIAAYGIGAEYDLGGGASVAGGIMDTDEAGTDAVYDLGMKFKF